MTDIHGYIAVRHGVIVGHGPTPEAAAAATSSVSRVSVRRATVTAWACAQEVAGRRLPDTERGLLRAIATDVRRVLWAVADGDGDYCHTRRPELAEYRRIDPADLDDAEEAALDDRLDAVSDEMDELAFLERQGDLFEAVPPPLR